MEFKKVKKIDTDALELDIIYGKFDPFKLLVDKELALEVRKAIKLVGEYADQIEINNIANIY